MPARTKGQGLIYEQAADFAWALEASHQAAADQMLAAWTDSYWGIRGEMDAFLEKVALAKAAGKPTSPAWAYQQARLKELLDTTKVQIARYAADAAQVTSKQQASAIQAALKHTEKLGQTALDYDLPGLGASFQSVNPKVLEAGVGFMADGGVLKNHLALTLPADAAKRVEGALIHGLATGKGIDWMVREATKGLGITHSRATTIMRTEALRAYRTSSRLNYLANSDVIGTWVWNAQLDSRTCVACALMDGTEHPLDAVLDGHPRCRCAMVPRTKSWEDLGFKDVADTRPPIRSGKEWLLGQPAHVQRAMMGRRKFDAWTEGTISLDDMVARTYSPQWGTMRTERSLKAILEGKHPNWQDSPAVPLNGLQKAPPAPQPHVVADWADRYSIEFLEEWAQTPGNGPQALANVQAALQMAKAKAARPLGPWFPKPDTTKVEAALEKLRQAVLNKGYPSKGYSQTQAIYKAQANGAVGSKVGVVKSLTWEQKITAQRILDQHNDELGGLIRKWRHKQAVEKAHAEALTINAAKDAEAALAKAQKAAEEAAESYAKALAAEAHKAGQTAAGYEAHLAAEKVALVKRLADTADDLTENTKAMAQWSEWVKANAKYHDAKAHVLGNKWAGTSWEATGAGKTGVIQVNEHGWGKISANGFDVDLPPHSLVETLDNPDAAWVQAALKPDPEAVKILKGNLSDADGFVDAIQMAKYEKIVKDLNPQGQANVIQAIEELKATGKWKPDPDAVAMIVKNLEDGLQTPTSLQDLLGKLPAQGKANVTKALEEWQAKQLAKATIDAKPVIDPTKIKWEKVSQAQVDKYVAQVQDPWGSTLTLDDLYAKFQAAKNSGPKANYAKAILTLEGKLDDIPKAVFKAPDLGADADLLADLSGFADNGVWDLEKFVKVAQVEGDPELAKAAQQLILKWYETGTIGESWVAKAGLQDYLKAGLTHAPKPKAVPTLDGLSDSYKATAKGWLSDVQSGTLTKADIEDVLDPSATWATANDKQMAKWVLHELGDDVPTKAPLPVAETPPPSSAWSTKPPFDPADLRDTGQVLGTHGARVYETADGQRWLFKPPKDARDGFLATLDEAANRFQALAGLKSPETWVVQVNGKRGSIQRMFQAHDPFKGGFRPADLAKVDLDAIQREHVVDWLLSNHDGHADQFLRLTNGDLVSIDKGQAFRWFGQDRLDWDFHPNSAYGTQEPVYNRLWRDFAAGKDVDLDPPGEGALWDQIKAMQAISDDDLKAMFRPYAEQAAAQGKLAVPQKYPGLVKGKVPPNDVEAFLDALVDRKNNLEKDFTALYEKAVKARQKALPGWTPKAAKPKGKWAGKDKPEAPKPPVEPKDTVAKTFDSWLDDAKQRYRDFSGGKDLEASHNWARFRRVVDDLDETAAKELLDRQYLTQGEYERALDLIAKGKAQKAALDADYKKALAAHDARLKAWKDDLAQWKDDNGIKDLTSGMDGGVVRHNSNQPGVTWAQKHFDHNRYTPGQRTTLQNYTGSSFRSWNDHLRATKGKPNQYHDAYAKIDKAMEAQPIPEDVILHRGIGGHSRPFEVNGKALGEHDDLSQIIGSVQADWGYMSTSVGGEAAFHGSGYPIQLKIRCPAGTPGSYVQMFSNFQTERELILARGTHFYVHNAYKDPAKGAWVVEVEVVPPDFSPVNATPTPSSTPWKAWL